MSRRRILREALVCAECGREQREGERGWRVFLVAAEEREREFDGPDVVEVFCPECAERVRAAGAAR